MWSYIARRLRYAVPILLGVSMLVFALIHLAPGGGVDLLVPPEVPREVADMLRRRFALDQPI
jgi:peptide/nickel transport system permease protein